MWGQCGSVPGLCEGLVGFLWEISVGLSEVSVWGHFLSVGDPCVGHCVSMWRYTVGGPTLVSFLHFRAGEGHRDFSEVLDAVSGGGREEALRPRNVLQVQ